MIHGQGEVKQQGNGGVRESSEGRGRFDLFPYEAMEALAKWYEEGCKKYGDRNWENGLSVKDSINRMVRHSIKAANGWTDEDHLSAVMWNAACAITMMARPNMEEFRDHPWKESKTEEIQISDNIKLTYESENYNVQCMYAVENPSKELPDCTNDINYKTCHKCFYVRFVESGPIKERENKCIYGIWECDSDEPICETCEFAKKELTVWHDPNTNDLYRQMSDGTIEVAHPVMSEFKPASLTLDEWKSIERTLIRVMRDE